MSCSSPFESQFETSERSYTRVFLMASSKIIALADCGFYSHSCWRLLEIYVIFWDFSVLRVPAAFFHITYCYNWNNLYSSRKRIKYKRRLHKIVIVIDMQSSWVLIVSLVPIIFRVCWLKESFVKKQTL